MRFPDQAYLHPPIGKHTTQNYMNIASIERSLRNYADPNYLRQMELLGISTKQALGVRMPKIKLLAKNIGRNHDLAQQIWALNHHEGRLLAGLVEEPDMVSREQAEAWVAKLQSWDEVDQMCGNLFQRLPFFEDLIYDWIQSDELFIKRAGFVLIVASSIHHKNRPDEEFHPYFDLIKKHAKDDRNLVKKAVNWALRQIGKRSVQLNGPALSCAEELLSFEHPVSNWIAKDAIKELKSEEVKERLEKKEEKRLKKIEREKAKEERRRKAAEKKAAKAKKKES